MNDFWDILWIILVSFLLVAFLLVLFQIVGDLFADKEASGWVKALWIVILLFLPLLGSVAYLVVRGRGMAERSARSAAAVRGEAEDYIRSIAGAGSTPTDEIARAKELRDGGVISEGEFERLKAAALSRAGG